MSDIVQKLWESAPPSVTMELLTATASCNSPPRSETELQREISARPNRGKHGKQAGKKARMKAFTDPKQAALL